MILLLWLLAELLEWSQPTPSFEFIRACLSVFCLCLFAARGAGSWIEEGRLGRCAALTDNSLWAAHILPALLPSWHLHPSWLGNPISACFAVQHSMLYGVFHHPSLYNNIPCCVVASKMLSVPSFPNWDMMQYFKVSIFHYFAWTLVLCML